MTKDEQNSLLDAVAGVLLRCFVLSICLMLLWFVFFLAAADWAYNIHSRWVDLTKPQFDLIIYCWMGLFKIIAFLFFLLPFIAIRLTLRKKQ